MIRQCGTWTLTLFAMALTGTAAGATSSDDAARQVLTQLVAHDFAGVRARLTPQMAQAIASPEVLAGVWQQITGMVGQFQRVDAVESHPAAEGRTATTLHCTFDKGALDVNLAFDGQGRVAGLHFLPPKPLATAGDKGWSLPAYAEPERYQERDVLVGAPPLALPGKLTVPRGSGPVAAVVLVHGSGATDENETVGPTAPFHDLAVGLASRGIAVLRYQKRAFAHPQSFSGTRFTVREETTDDARAAVALLARTAGIDRGRIFVLGHSLGGMLAPRIAEQDPLVAGLVLLAAPARPLEELVLEQVTARGTPAEVAAAKQALQRIRDPKLAASDVVDFAGVAMPASYFLDLRSYSATQTAARLKLPILVLQGDRDIQVRPTDFAAWTRALRSNRRAQLKHYPTLTHLFAEGDGTLADYSRPSHVAASVITDIANFVAGAKPQ